MVRLQVKAIPFTQSVLVQRKGAATTGRPHFDFIVKTGYPAAVSIWAASISKLE